MKINVPVQDDFLNALLSGKRIAASQIVFDLLKSDETIEDIYEKVIRQALYHIGALWENGSISIPAEHLASAIVQAIQNELYSEILSQNKNSKTVVVACVENEQHQIGIRMVADIFEMNEWNSHFLGSGIPVGELIRFMKSVQSDMVALSVSLQFNISSLETMIQMIRKEMPGLMIIYGGQAFNRGGAEYFLKYSNVSYLKDLYELKLFLSKQALIY